MDPNFEAKAAFAAHWAGVTVTRSNPTFDGVPPNHDHMIVIANPSKPAPAKRGPSTSKPKRSALAGRIPVVFA
jgi:hypothetical protein